MERNGSILNYPENFLRELYEVLHRTLQEQNSLSKAGAIARNDNLLSQAGKVLRQQNLLSEAAAVMRSSQIKRFPR